MWGDAVARFSKQLGTSAEIFACKGFVANLAHVTESFWSNLFIVIS